MTFLAPGFFFASLAVAAAVVALHFIVTRQPRAGILPTARFVPDLPATATARATRPSDIPLMLLRVFLVLAVGAGLAKPVLRPSRGAEARVILVDVSRASRDSTAIRDSARALFRNHDALIAFDSSARIVKGANPDSIGSLHFSRAQGNLSAALVAAMHAASVVRENADSLELVIVSPIAAHELDAATSEIRKLWKGRARIVQAGWMTFNTPDDVRIEVRAAAGDPIQVPVSRLAGDSSATAIIMRAGLDEASGSRAVVHWPVNDRPIGAIARASRDTIGGVASGDALVVASFERRWSFPSDSIRGAEIVARWIDGEPAAIEKQNGSGCVRSVAVNVPATGDLVLQAGFQRFVAALARDCYDNAFFAPASEEAVTSLAGAGALALRETFKPRGDARSTIAPWLIALAIAAAVAEMWLRRMRKTSAAASASGGDVRRAA